MKLASFDIFDTTLIRKCGKPENIFYLMASDLYPNDIAKKEDFIVWRKSAPSNINKSLKKVELTLQDIYCAKGVDSFNEYTADELIEKELETETANLIANPNIVKLINKKRDEGYCIAFISDMYIGSDVLRNILEKEECIKPEDRIYVSCEIQARKDSGQLYRYVKEELNPDFWEHYGDNLHSDIKVAKRNGIKAHIINSHNNSLEQRLERLSINQPSLRELSILAGLSKCIRVTNNNPYATIASNYVASTYIPFVLWLLDTAQKEGIKTLYFLSRDSYILLKIAESLPHEGIELRYLYISRRSLMRPYMYNSQPKDYLEVVDRHTLIGRDVRHMLWQLLLTKEELHEKYGIEFDYERISNKKEEEDFIGKLYNSKFTATFQAEAKNELNILIEYLEQEKVTSSEKKAFVDVGWLGTSRLMINSILKKGGVAPVDFIYLGTRNDVFPCSYGKYYSYFRAGTLNTNMTSVIENYFSASPYPTTIGYKKKRETLEPIFPEGKTITHTAITEVNVAVAIWIAKEIGKYNIKNDATLSTWAICTLHSLANMKDDIDVTPFTVSNDFDNEVFAKKFSFEELVKFLLLGKRITHFDFASLKYTCGLSAAHKLVKIHHFTNRLRNYIFKKIYH